MPKTDRIPCCVPFCKRTAKYEPDTEIICGKHYRLADVRSRRLLTRIKKKMNKADAAGDIGKALEMWFLYTKVWVRIKKQVIERSAGI